MITNSELQNLLLDPFFKDKINKSQDGWRQVCSLAISHGVPIPAMTSSLSYFDGYRAERLPANLLQAQRDYFGAHTYERLDAKKGEFFHTEWIKGRLIMKPEAAIKIKSFVLFGALGDLSIRKLIPAWYYLERDHMLDDGLQILGVGRQGC